MNRAEAIYFAPIIQAFSEGKVIEVVDKDTQEIICSYGVEFKQTFNTRRELDIEEFDTQWVEYRIKP